MNEFLNTLLVLMHQHPLLTAMAYLVLGCALLVQSSVMHLNRMLQATHEQWWADYNAKVAAQQEAMRNAPRKTWTFMDTHERPAVDFSHLQTGI